MLPLIYADYVSLVPRICFLFNEDARTTMKIIDSVLTDAPETLRDLWDKSNSCSASYTCDDFDVEYALTLRYVLEEAIPYLCAHWNDFNNELATAIDALGFVPIAMVRAHSSYFLSLIASKG